jgi:type IV pilus assembly protein PilX
MSKTTIRRLYLRSQRQQQKGLAIIIVLGLMSVVFVIAAISVRLTLLAERSSRNDRDRQIAFQAAEAALADAELDIMGPNSASNKRCAIRSKHLQGLFVPSCGTSTTDKTRGLCALNANTQAPQYTRVNFEEIDDSLRKYSQFGEFTGRSSYIKDSSAGGISAKNPGYIIEVVNHIPPVSANGQPPEAGPAGEQAFLITAVGYGPSINTKVMLQAMIFKPLATPGC